jgi:hypothetical protein
MLSTGVMWERHSLAQTLAQTGFFTLWHSPASLAQTGFFSAGHSPASVAPGRAGFLYGTDYYSGVAPGRASRDSRGWPQAWRGCVRSLPFFCLTMINLNAMGIKV